VQYGLGRSSVSMLSLPEAADDGEVLRSRDMVNLFQSLLQDFSIPFQCSSNKDLGCVAFNV
jgi:hypothetical protein